MLGKFSIFASWLGGGGVPSSSATKVGHWPLQDYATNDDIIAVTGSDGVIIGGKTSQQLSVAGPNANLPRAIQYANGDYISIPPTNVLNNKALFSIMCWGLTPPSPLFPVQHPLMSISRSTTVQLPRITLAITRLVSSNYGQYQVLIDTGPTSTTAIVSAFMDVSGWHHYAVTVDLIGKVVRLYRDGVLVLSSVQPSLYSPSPGDPLRFTGGLQNINNSPTLQYSGLAAADLRLYDGILTASEIAAAMDGDPDTPDSSPEPSSAPEETYVPASTQLWFTNWPSGQVERADVGLNGLERREIISTGYIDLFQIEIDRYHQQLYWTADKKIWKADLDGTNLDYILEHQEDTIGLVLDPINELIYYSTPNEIRVVRFDGTLDQLVTQATATSLALDIPGGQLCYVDADDDDPVIVVYNLRTGNSWTLDISGAIGGLRVHKSRLWFTLGGENSTGVWSCDFLGSDVRQETVDGRAFAKFPRQLEIDQTGIYLNTTDGPDQQWYVPPTIAGAFTGIAHGITRYQLNQGIDWADYLAMQNSDDPEEPSNAVQDVTILTTDEIVPAPEASDKIILISEDRITLREVDISSTPVITNDLTYPVSSLILVGDLAANIQGVVIDPRSTREIDLETNHIYYAEGFDPVQPTANTIRKSHFGDIFSTEVGPTRPDPVDLAIDTSNDKIYILTNTEIIRSNLDGSNQEILIDTGIGYFSQQSCVWDGTNGVLIWAAGRNGEYGIYRGKSVNGRWVVTPSYTSPATKPMGVTADPDLGHLYWCDGLTPRVFRMNYDGTGITEINLGEHVPLYLKLGTLSRSIYWSELTGVYRSQLDGSDIELVVEDDIHHRFDVLE